MAPKIWFTSDAHLGHKFVAELRGFASVEEHDAVLLDNWAKAVGPDDQVWVLGDLALARWLEALDTLQKLPGHKHLIPGNHDKCHGMYRDSTKYLPIYLEAFESVQLFARRRINGHSVMLSHLPFSLDRGLEPRYVEYRLRDCGSKLLHGHTHAKSQISEDGREVHVGVDAHSFAPVSLDEVAALLA